ncbi:hypothetical protein SAMN04487948_11332 [Halogranum amylolyticum]|uniref:Uncharacterized protein n=1 Tax=Halogranum amylolyticum TaxID=660520 RepID=A0A1H8UXI6_9EURY|nr:hypothetical protein [Halogranum amylolyticum]SEP07879.1 hypothetical protein SAMN04487948_11332 [Halogranum amylolyticum]
MSAREELEMHLSQALSRTEDTEVQAHLYAALESTEELPPTPLVECPVCGTVGLAERIERHDCQVR